jgi:two-component system chemotaxis sensor kinase CheA
VDELLQVFLEESRELLQQLEIDLLDMEKDPGEKEIINRIFRAAHTIKGSAGLVGLTEINTLAHHMEDVLDQVRSTGEPMSRECFDAVFRSMDMLNKMIDITADSEEIPKGMGDELKEQLTGFVGAKKQGKKKKPAVVNLAVSEKTIYKIVMKFKPDIMEAGNDPIRFLGELKEKGKILESNVNFSKLPEIEEMDPYTIYLSWQIVLETECGFDDLHFVFIFVMDDNEITITDITKTHDSDDDTAKQLMGEILVSKGIIDESELEDSLKKHKKIGEILVEDAKVSPKQIEGVLEKQQKAREKEQNNTIRVDTKRLEKVLNFVSELVISQSRVKEMVSQLNKGEMEVFTAFKEVDRIIRQLQEEVMKTSMIPIGSTFTRFQRMVRDTATEKGKDIKLVITGQETELDKREIEQIADPLKHMIRNSIDHGIEMPDEREAAGKARHGTIILNAYHQEGNIIIEVSDDGKGLDPEKIRRKAVEKGLIDEHSKLSEQEMYNLIMQPGFSTADIITDISGRGVGLDVVATNIQSLRGSVDIESTPGKGTKFFIKLPLTLAIIDGMMVTIGNERFIIPLTSIVEFIKAEPGDIKTVEGAGRAVHVRKEYIPLAFLYQLLGMPAFKKEPTEGLLVIIKDVRKKIALLVDDILGQEQVVIKSMRENYKQVDSVAGATVMGDGRVAAILDVPTLIKMAGRIKLAG